MKLPHGYTLHHIDSVDCIMSEARRLAQSGADDATLLLADQQKNGTGRRGIDWQSSQGDLHAALLLRPEFSRERALELVHVAILSLGTAIGEQVSGMTELRYRWPNAILISRGRVAGLFVDIAPSTETSSHPAWMIIGMAVNMHRYPPGLGLEASALAGDGDCTPDRNELIESFSRHFLAAINQWADEGLAPFVRQWQLRADGRDEALKLQLQKGSLEAGKNWWMDETGALQFETDNGARHRVTLADYFALD